MKEKEVYRKGVGKYVQENPGMRQGISKYVGTQKSQ